MAEAEDVITDAARHATVFAQRMWTRHRAGSGQPPVLRLAEAGPRLALLCQAVFGAGLPLRAAQPPPRPTFLQQVFERKERTFRDAAVPATDGAVVWLPLELRDECNGAFAHYRAMLLHQAARAVRGSAQWMSRLNGALERDLFLLLEAAAVETELVHNLPGMAESMAEFRQHCRRLRPALSDFPPVRQGVEVLVRELMDAPTRQIADPATPQDCAAKAAILAQDLICSRPGLARLREPVLKDLWTGELRPPAPVGPVTSATAPGQEDEAAQDGSVRSARLARRPKVREAPEDEDDREPGAWMIQTAQPHEHAEDPMGMQRPTDRDEKTAAEEHADSLSELPEARLVSTPGRPKEVLLSDDPPPVRRHTALPQAGSVETVLVYPEWDCRQRAYRHPGARVQLRRPLLGSPDWVKRVMDEHAAMLQGVRRRFEMLRARRERLRRQLDGDEPDLAAWLEARTDFLAGLPMSERLYQCTRVQRRDTAIMMLIDVSGSTDGWISAQRRVIDVEREALLVVSHALEGMGEPYSVQAFSGEGPQGVWVRQVKGFDEPHSAEVDLRIAALEPEQYTRAGAALRHATALLMRQPAQHRLLMLLSDGKPNDVDEYEGRYGVEDMRQAVQEARLQGVHPFCLTIDRQAANYLPHVFGVHHYALLQRPEQLSRVLLDWMRRLLIR